jgi:hypothetical protein
VIAGDDHRAVCVVRLVRLEGDPPFGWVECTAEVLLDCQACLAVLVDGLKEASQPSLLCRKRMAADPRAEGRSRSQLFDRKSRTGHMATVGTAGTGTDRTAALA